MPRPVLSFTDAALGYAGTPVVRQLHFDIHEGEAVALVGPNGSGKTTLLRAVLGAVRVLEGTVDLGDTRIGYVPQSVDVDLTFPVTVREVVTMGLVARLGWWGRLGRHGRAKVGQALERVGLADRADRRFGELSGGQRQRVLLARAQVGDPGLVLLDEPFNGLDEPNRAALLDQIQQMKAEGVAFLASTHDFDLARHACDHALLLAGRQVAFGGVEQVLAPEVLALAYGGHAGDEVVREHSLTVARLASVDLTDSAPASPTLAALGPTGPAPTEAGPAARQPAGRAS
ncbi:metal ABC transporter ATP-binding protein [Schaalia sp. 19OD2882]|uniref:metal ABC transporter ATP-binding protein n=1 Tax=Schaalia sp. 19OD2882 TaxID=2794089 RepID=UPI001C1EE6A7|nr:metal ABC transporter ATP-binding protein [Schaalia sp. 19OD2882]